MCGGGGPVDIVTDVFEGVGDAVSDVVSGVGDAVSGVVEGAGDVLASIDPGPVLSDIGQGVTDFVSDAGVMLDEAVGDIIPGGWGMVGAVALTVATAGTVNLEAEALAAEVGAEIAAETLASEVAAETLAGELAAEGLASGEIAGLTSGATDAALAQGAMDASTIANLSADPIETLNALNNWTGPMTGNIGTAAVELANQGLSQSELANYLASQFGIDEFAAANAAGIASAGGDAASIADVLAADYGAEMAGVAGANTGITGAEALSAAKKAMQAAQIAKTGYGLINALTGGTGNVSRASPLTRTSGLTDALGGNKSAGTSAGSSTSALPGNLEATSLAAAPVTQGSTNMNINQLKQLYPQLSTIDPKLLQTLMGKASASSAMGDNEPGGVTGLSMSGQGGTPSAGYPAIAADKITAGSKFMTTPLSGKYDALSEAGLRMLSNGSGGSYGALPSGLKDGGQPHVPQFKTGTTGHYVQGAGDGQSDDIPAMLADGEYVFDADTVAALGNGSNKAGALQLDRMRQEIRKHKRAAPHNKIPPKAKSPLEYMKGK
jgi:hypothetical protein